MPSLVFGHEAFGRYLDGDAWVGAHDETSALIRRDIKKLASSLVSPLACSEERPQQDRGNPRKELLPDPNPAGTLNLDFWSP